MKTLKRAGLLSATALAAVLCVSGAQHAVAAQAMASSIQAVEGLQANMVAPADYTYQGHHYAYRNGGKYYNYRYKGKYYNHRRRNNGVWSYY